METLDRHTISDAIARLAPRYRVSRAYLFGSYARGEADSASDVDICIVPATGFTLFSLGGLGKHLEDALGTPVDIVYGEDPFYPRAKERYSREKVLLYEKP